MNKTLIFGTGANRVFWRLPQDVQERLNRKLYLYGLTGAGDVKRMVGANTFRVRDGEYRIVFEETSTSLTILSVGHRRNVYR